MSKLFCLFSFSFVAFTATTSLAADKKVERMWKAKCSACHGMDGKGQTEKGKKQATRDMTTAEYQAGKDEDWKKAINDGLEKTTKEGVKQKMEPYKEELKAPDVDALIAFIRELGGKK